MVATVKMYYDLGGADNSPGTSHNITDNGTNKIRFKTADVLGDTIDANNPIPVPSSGASKNYSYWKQVYMEVTAGTFTQIDNVKFYTDGGGFGTGIKMLAGDEFPTHTSAATTGYELADGTPGTTGTEMGSHAEITGTTDAFTYTSGSPLSVSISESGNVIDATNETTDYVVLQLQVASNASSGTLTAETLTFRYDEI